MRTSQAAICLTSTSCVFAPCPDADGAGDALWSRRLPWRIQRSDWWGALHVRPRRSQSEAALNLDQRSLDRCTCFVTPALVLDHTAASHRVFVFFCYFNFFRDRNHWTGEWETTENEYLRWKPKWSAHSAMFLTGNCDKFLVQQSTSFSPWNVVW